MSAGANVSFQNWSSKLIIQSLFYRRELKQYNFLLVWPIGLVRFANDVCTSLEGFDGTCYTSYQCSSLDGLASGSCALNGIGTCCICRCIQLYK